jgi:hypothetical protein
MDILGEHLNGERSEGRERQGFLVTDTDQQRSMISKPYICWLPLSISFVSEWPACDCCKI